MAKRKKRKGGPHKPEHGQAARIRRKIRDGSEVSVADLEWLKTYEANKQTPGRPLREDVEASADDADDTDDDDSNEDNDPDLVDATSAGAPDGAPQPVTPESTTAIPVAPTAPPPTTTPTDTPPIGRPPRLGRPPRVRADADDDPRRDAKEDWRAKYRAGAKASGREHTVTKIADGYVGLLQVLADQIKLAGVEPLVDPQMIRAAVVLTVDDLLPAHLQIEPHHEVALATSVLVFQRFAKRKDIAAAVAKARETEEHRKRNEQRRESADQARKESEAQRDSGPAREPITPVADPPASASPDPVSVPADVPPGATNGSRRPVGPYAGMSAHDILASDPTAVL